MNKTIIGNHPLGFDILHNFFGVELNPAIVERLDLEGDFYTVRVSFKARGSGDVITKTLKEFQEHPCIVNYSTSGLTFKVPLEKRDEFNKRIKEID